MERHSPTITLGPYASDQLSVDHVIPFAVAPSLDHVIANLELMPLRMKNAEGLGGVLDSPKDWG